MPNMGLFPNHEGWLSQGFKSSHLGIDIGWIDTISVPCRAWADGVCIENSKDPNGSAFVIIQHDDGRWTGYWHVAYNSGVAVGTRVKEGQTVAYRSFSGTNPNTHKPFPPHLHFVMTKTGMPSKYNWYTMTGNAIDPIPHCYKLKSDKIEDVKLPLKPDTPNPVKRNESVHQVEILASALRCRTAPSLKGEVIDTMQKGYYNVLSTRSADGYQWDELAKDRWIATNDKEGWTKDLPAYDPDAEIKQLTAENARLTKENQALAQSVAGLKTSLSGAEKRISDAVEVLTHE
jgi:hypothetical protein